MNACLNLWSIITGLGESLARTKELVDRGNERLEQALALSEPIKVIEADKKRKSQAA